MKARNLTSDPEQIFQRTGIIHELLSTVLAHAFKQTRYHNHRSDFYFTHNIDHDLASRLLGGRAKHNGVVLEKQRANSQSNASHMECSGPKISELAFVKRSSIRRFLSIGLGNKAPIIQSSKVSVGK